jgi:hypothetical protein
LPVPVSAFLFLYARFSAVNAIDGFGVFVVYVDERRGIFNALTVLN